MVAGAKSAPSPTQPWASKRRGSGNCQGLAGNSCGARTVRDSTCSGMALPSESVSCQDIGKPCAAVTPAANGTGLLRGRVRAMPRKSSSGTEARRRVDRLRALRNSPAQLHDFAIEVLADEGNPEIAKVALQSLGESIQPADAPVLRSLYNHFDTDGPKRDPGGDVRVEVLRALWPLRSAADRELAMHARNTFERTLQSTGEMIR